MKVHAPLLFTIALPFLACCSSTSGIIKSQAQQEMPVKAATSGGSPELPEEPSDEDGVFHIVGRNETLEQICAVYSLDLEKIAAINRLEAPYTLEEGDSVFLAASAMVEDMGEDRQTRSPPDRSAQKKPKQAKKPRSVRKVASAISGKRHPDVPLLEFPVPGGTLTSPFGYRWGIFHKGLDIAASRGTPVLACAAGKVIFAGTRKRFRNYGKIVLLRHADNVYTQYGHLQKIHVKKGQKVRRGQKIAAVGNTGRSTGPHLHLEVRVDNKLYNPLAYFPAPELKGTRVAKRFRNSPMGPVPAHWRIPELLTARK